MKNYVYRNTGSKNIIKTLDDSTLPIIQINFNPADKNILNVLRKRLGINL